MSQTHPLTLEALAKMRQEDYLREAEQHRQAVAAERRSESSMGAVPRAVGRFRGGLVRTGLSRVPAHSQ